MTSLVHATKVLAGLARLAQVFASIAKSVAFVLMSSPWIAVLLASLHVEVSDFTRASLAYTREPLAGLASLAAAAPVGVAKIFPYILTLSLRIAVALTRLYVEVSRFAVTSLARTASLWLVSLVLRRPPPVSRIRSHLSRRRRPRSRHRWVAYAPRSLICAAESLTNSAIYFAHRATSFASIARFLALLWSCQSGREVPG